MRSDSESPYKKTWRLKSLEKQTIENQEINAKFCLKKLLGAGGYAGVYLADEVKQDTLIRQVAVKLIPPDPRTRQQRQQELELRTSLELRHPHVLQFFYTGKCQLEEKVKQDDGQYRNETREYLYLVMELAEKTLAQHRQDREGILPEKDTWNVLESLASALVYFSERSPQLVHRDLKPENVLWVGNCWKISDFGIVRDTGITTTLVGTPEYAPAEAYGGNVPCAWDVWSLGITILEMITGTLLSAKKEPQLQLELDHIISKLPSSFHQDIIRAIKDCLKEKPEERLTAEQLEVQFIIPRLVQEVWKPETEQEKAQAKEAVSIVIMFRPKLKTKTKNPNILLRYLLKWTKLQHPLLTLLLKWVCDAPGIPTEGNDECIADLVRSHIKHWNAQKLAEYLDFDAPANSFWRGLGQNPDKPLALVDEFLASPNFGDQGKIKKITKVLDDYRAASYHRNVEQGETNFQRLILNSLNHKFSDAQTKVDQLLPVYVKQWKAQDLANCLEFDAPASSFWLGLNQKYGHPFALVDEFLAMPNLGDEEKIKTVKKILDEYRKARYNRGGYKGETNFQRLILDSLETKFSEAQKTMARHNLDQLLTEVVNQAQGDLVAILIFDLTEGLPLYHNRQLKQSNLELYHALFGEGGDIGGEAIQGFNTLNGIQDALNKFGEQTKFGDLTYSVFKLKSGTMIVSFLEIGIPLAICFIAPEGKNLGTVLLRYNMKINEIKDAVRAILA